MESSIAIIIDLGNGDRATGSSWGDWRLSVRGGVRGPGLDGLAVGLGPKLTLVVRARRADTTDTLHADVNSEADARQQAS